MTSLVRVTVIIPVRSLAGAKSRLGEPLDQEEREALVTGLLTRTIAAAVGARCVTSVVVVSEDAELLALAQSAGATPLLQRTEGLNDGLEEARAALPRNVDAAIVVPVDLPGVSNAEIDWVVERAEREATNAPSRAGVAAPTAPLVVLVPDRHGTGTNVLLLAPPTAIPFLFGEGSRARHAAAAARAGATYVELDGPLSFDVDTPDDLLLADLSGLGHEAGR